MGILCEKCFYILCAKKNRHVLNVRKVSVSLSVMQRILFEISNNFICVFSQEKNPRVWLRTICGKSSPYIKIERRSVTSTALPAAARLLSMWMSPSLYSPSKFVHSSSRVCILSLCMLLPHSWMRAPVFVSLSVLHLAHCRNETRRTRWLPRRRAAAVSCFTSGRAYRAARRCRPRRVASMFEPSHRQENQTAGIPSSRSRCTEQRWNLKTKRFSCRIQ